MPSRVISRYVVREFVSVFAPILVSFIGVYLIIDFFERLDGLLRNDATVALAVRYFLFKVPLMITQVTPPAVLAAVLISLGTISRRNEIVAFRALGVSLGQMAIPLLGVAALISAASLAWDETVVPYCSRQFQYVNDVQIKKRPVRGLLSSREIWYHGRDGFYNIDYVDAAGRTLHGLTIYTLDSSFGPSHIIEVPTARWDGRKWLTSSATERAFEGGQIVTRALAANSVAIPETIDDFLEVHRTAEELSFTQLRQRIATLARKGIDTSSDWIDLHLKLAVPFASLVLTLMGIPLAGRVRRHPSVSGVIGVGLAAGFGYWVVLALANSLARGGALPAPVAAWSANGIFLLVGLALFLGRE
ncbi:MAG TPA: LPS export ABC transporter permease LptG [Candidatus Kryptonia bacterium]|nr:LPS export ABC transporter permease LptG [Candidatus Kryptonia bacterium]